MQEHGVAPQRDAGDACDERIAGRAAGHPTVTLSAEHHAKAVVLCVIRPEECLHLDHGDPDVRARFAQARAAERDFCVSRDVAGGQRHHA